MSTLTDKMFQQLSQSISKAINSLETPVKEKHVRSTIIGTFHEKGAVTYWVVALRLPLQDNRIVAWKFCHVTHKLLREGHPACLTDSSRHINTIQDLGNLWKHLKEGYGKLILLYCNLLVTKLQFHAHNPRFPGNLSLTAEELDAIAENDVNNYFQLCVELFDYMDDILKLQAAVFDSLDNMRWTSMTSAGQCRLGALLACAQDSSQLYDCGVRLLFRLHAALPADILTGHRTRFHEQFRKLAAFYKHLHNMQYFRNLLTVPQLPDKPPNFLMQSDFGTYVPPVMVVPEEPPEEVDTVGSLIDTSETFSQPTTSPENYDTLDTRTTPSPQPDLLIERDRLIDHLQGELKRLRNENHSLASEKNSMLVSMRDHCTKLEVDLKATRDQLQEEISKNEKLAVISPELEQKVNDAEGKAKVTDEKFQKLKSAYTQLRDEHINLIRQKAEIDKAAANMRSTMVELEANKVVLEQKLNDQSREVDTLQQSASTADTINAELEAARTELAQLRTELEMSKAREVELEALKISMATLSADHGNALKTNEDKIASLQAEVLEMENQVADLQNDKAKVECYVESCQEELKVERSRSGEGMAALQVKLSTVEKELADLKLVYGKTVSDKDGVIAKLSADVETYENEKKVTNDEYNEKITCFESVIANLKSLVEKSNGNTKVIESELEAVKKDLEVARSKAGEDVSSLQTIISDLEKQLANLRVDFDVASSEKEALIDKLTVDIKAHLDEKKTEINDMQARLETSNAKIKRGEVELEGVKIDLEVARSTASDDVASLQINLSNVEKQLAELKVQHNEDLVENAKLKSDVETYVEDKKVTIAAYEEKIVSLEAELGRQNAQLDVVSSEKGKLEDDLFMAVTELDEAKNNAEEKMSTLRETISTIEKELINIKVECEASIAEKENIIVKLRDEVANTENNKKESLKSYEDKITALENDVLSKQLEVESAKTEKRNVDEELESIKGDLLEAKRAAEEDAAAMQGKVDYVEHELEDLKLEHEQEILEKDGLIKSLKEEVVLYEREKKEIEEKYMDKLAALDREVNLKSACIENSEKEKGKVEVELSQAKRETSEFQNKLDSVQLELLDLKMKHEQATDESAGVITTLRADIAFCESERKSLEERLNRNENERLTVECELQDLLQHNHSLEEELGKSKADAQRAQGELQKYRAAILESAARACLELITKSAADLDVSSSIEHTESAAKLASDSFLQLAARDKVEGAETEIAHATIASTHHTAQLATHLASMAATLTDVDVADKLVAETRSALDSARECVEIVAAGRAPGTAARGAAERAQALAGSAAAAPRAAPSAATVDDELANMDQAIEEAAQRIEEMVEASKSSQSGVKLEVSGRILEACTGLMAAVRTLVRAARALQGELGGAQRRARLYARNPQWSEGLISAAKAVVLAAKLLVSSADEAVEGSGALEAVAAASHEVAGSTAALVAASRARAPPASAALAALAAASRTVARATGALVAVVRSAATLVADHEDLETTALTLTAARRLEMESKVRSLELEAALDAERTRLAALRRRHYQLAQVDETGAGEITNGDH